MSSIVIMSLKNLNQLYDTTYKTYFDENGSAVTNLAYGKWFINVWGYAQNRGTSTHTYQGVALNTTNNAADSDLAKTDNISMNWPDGNFNVLQGFVVDILATNVPGRTIYGYIDGIAAERMTGYRISL
jgi:hypothetical protein